MLITEQNKAQEVKLYRVKLVLNKSVSQIVRCWDLAATPSFLLSWVY